jgi:hypothetical protein
MTPVPVPVAPILVMNPSSISVETPAFNYDGSIHIEPELISVETPPSFAIETTGVQHQPHHELV